MGLSVYLLGPSRTVECRCSCCDHEHVREEREEYWGRNLTHNLIEMADAADLYKVLWRPEELGFTKASMMIEPLKGGLAKLISDPTCFKKFNPPNGWGSYELLVSFMRSYLSACQDYPDAEICADR